MCLTERVLPPEQVGVGGSDPELHQRHFGQRGSPQAGAVQTRAGGRQHRRLASLLCFLQPRRLLRACLW